jgi:hypothetical protein
MIKDEGRSLTDLVLVQNWFTELQQGVATR